MKKYIYEKDFQRLRFTPSRETLGTPEGVSQGRKVPEEGEIEWCD